LLRRKKKTQRLVGIAVAVYATIIFYHIIFSLLFLSVVVVVVYYFEIGNVNRLCLSLGLIRLLRLSYDYTLEMTVHMTHTPGVMLGITKDIILDVITYFQIFSPLPPKQTLYFFSFSPPFSHFLSRSSWELAHQKHN